MNAQHWHTLAIPAAVAALRTDAGRGLDEAEAARRLDETGPNELLDQGGQHPLTILWGQLRGVMSLLLVAAAAVSAYLGDWRDAAVIGAIINFAFGRPAIRLIACAGAFLTVAALWKLVVSMM